jgi:hypothetical protein
MVKAYSIDVSVYALTCIGHSTNVNVHYPATNVLGEGLSHNTLVDSACCCRNDDENDRWVCHGECDWPCGEARDCGYVVKQEGGEAELMSGKIIMLLCLPCLTMKPTVRQQSSIVERHAAGRNDQAD